MVRTCLLALQFLLLDWSCLCQQADVSSQMIKRAHAYLYDGLAKSPQNKEKISKVQERVDQDHCVPERQLYIFCLYGWNLRCS